MRYLAIAAAAAFFAATTAGIADAQSVATGPVALTETQLDAVTAAGYGKHKDGHDWKHWHKDKNKNDNGGDTAGSEDHKKDKHKHKWGKKKNKNDNADNDNDNNNKKKVEVVVKKVVVFKNGFKIVKFITIKNGVKKVKVVKTPIKNRHADNDNNAPDHGKKWKKRFGKNWKKGGWKKFAHK